MSLAKKASDLPAYERGCDYFSTCSWAGNVFNYAKELQQLEDAIVNFAASVGIRAQVTSRLRTCCEQATLYATGKTTARPTTSQHEFGFAFDLVPVSGYSRYSASRADATAWLIALAKFYGADGLVESDHAHVQWYTSDQWARFIKGRDIASSIPIPGKRPKA